MKTKKYTETYTYADKYEYETDSDGAVETKSYQEEKPTFDESESVQVETMAPIIYRSGLIKNVNMNEEYVWWLCMFSDRCSNYKRYELCI